MTLTRIAVATGIALLTAFAVIVVVAGKSGAGAAVVALVAIAALVAAGNLLYGRHSHGAAAQARIRPAQEAADRAADLAAETRRATAEAARRGERFCPLDPAAGHPFAGTPEPDESHLGTPPTGSAPSGISRTGT